MKALVFRAVIGAALCVIPALASAQAGDKFGKGSRIASVGVMLGGLNDGIGLGGMAEVGALPLGKFTLGIGGMAGFQRDSEGGASVTTIPLMGIGNVHFPVASQPKLDLYAGASVGFIRVSASADGLGGEDVGASDSDIGIGIQGGARYKLGGGTNVFGQVGLGDNPLIFAGISFKF